ncbi:hypothetical protein AB0I22_13135 [Streptomyces sp. NPDC050610]
MDPATVLCCWVEPAALTPLNRFRRRVGTLTAAVPLAFGRFSTSGQFQ